MFTSEHAAASGSRLSCGRAACPPRPLTWMCSSSQNAVSGPSFTPHLAGGEVRVDVSGEDVRDPPHRPAFAEPVGAPAVLLGGLEQEPQADRRAVPLGGGAAGGQRREQGDGGVRVVPAGVHQAGAVAGEGHVRLLADPQRVHVPANRDPRRVRRRRAEVHVADRPRHVAEGAGGEAGFGQRVRHEGGGAPLLAAGLGRLVEMAAGPRSAVRPARPPAPTGAPRGGRGGRGRGLAWGQSSRRRTAGRVSPHPPELTRRSGRGRGRRRRRRR